MFKFAAGVIVGTIIGPTSIIVAVSKFDLLGRLAGGLEDLAQRLNKWADNTDPEQV